MMNEWWSRSVVELMGAVVGCVSSWRNEARKRMNNGRMKGMVNERRILILYADEWMDDGWLKFNIWLNYK